MRNGSGILHELATTTAVHVSDLDHHVRAARAASAELRDRVALLRAQLSEAAAVRERELELQRALGERVLGVHRELEQARARVEEHLATIDAAADEEVRHIGEAERVRTARLQQAIDSLAGHAESAEVVLFTPRPIGDAVDRESSVDDRSVAM